MSENPVLVTGTGFVKNIVAQTKPGHDGPPIDAAVLALNLEVPDTFTSPNEVEMVVVCDHGLLELRDRVELKLSLVRKATDSSDVRVSIPVTEGGEP